MSKKCKLFFVRHCEKHYHPGRRGRIPITEFFSKSRSRAERERLIQAWNTRDAHEVALTNTGQRHASAIAICFRSYAERLGANPQHLYSSNYLRTKQTAAPIAKVFDLPVEVRDELREINDARMEYPFPHYCEYLPDYCEKLSQVGFLKARPFGGESHADVRDGRVSSFLKECQQRGEDAIIVAHAGVLTCVRQIVYEERDEDVVARLSNETERNAPYGSILAVHASAYGLRPIPPLTCYPAFPPYQLLCEPPP